MKATKDLKAIRAKIKELRLLETKIIKSDLVIEFGKAASKFYSRGFEDLEEFKNEILSIADKFQYTPQVIKKEEKANEQVSGHSDKVSTNGIAD